MLILTLIATLAAIVNGALGYGFSSVTVPLALLVVDNRSLTPALVLVEVALNAYALWCNRGRVAAVWSRAALVIAGLVPGIVIGSAALLAVDVATLKLATFIVLLPLALLRLTAIRRTVKTDGVRSVAIGSAVGVLYATTTISGPPLAMLFMSQRLPKQDFRAALSVVRFAEATIAALIFRHAGLFTSDNASLIAYLVPGVAIGVPIGSLLIGRIRDSTFRRWCALFDATSVAFGLSTLIKTQELARPPIAYLPLAIVLAIDAFLVFRGFRSTSADGGREVIGAATPLPASLRSDS